MYKMIDSLPPMKFYLSPKTREYFKTLFDKCETNQDESNVKAVKGAWGKGSGMIGKIAIAFHVINFCSKNETPPLEIPARTIRNAALVMGFYVRQIELIYSFCDELSDLSTELAKVLAIADRNGGKCSIRDVRRSFNANSAPSPEQVQLWFSELVAMNKGRITTLGRKVEFVVGENLLATLATNGNMVLPVESLDT
jgi:hypothetical protein